MSKQQLRPFVYAFAAFVAGAMIASAMIAPRVNKLEARDAIGILSARDFTRGERVRTVRTPDLDGLPKVARGVAYAEGSIDFEPRAEVEPEKSRAPDAADAAMPRSSTSDRECAPTITSEADRALINPGDLRGGCAVTIARVGGEPWFKVSWWGEARTPTGNVRRDEVLPLQRADVAREALHDPRRLDLLLGGTSGLDASIGLSWASRRRYGWYAALDLDPATGRPERVSAGIVIRLRR